MDTLWENEREVALRVQCDCTDVSHAADFCLLDDDRGRILDIDFAERYLGEHLPWYRRVQRAWRVLRGKDVWGHGFAIRHSDAQAISDLLLRFYGTR